MNTILYQEMLIFYSMLKEIWERHSNNDCMFFIISQNFLFFSKIIFCTTILCVYVFNKIRRDRSNILRSNSQVNIQKNNKS
jgi:hypothetical protein